MRRTPIEDLRRTIDCLPLRTREAMLRGIREDDIIVGAYQTPGGNCPMLAAHRRGGRTSFLSFARAWDRFAGARRPRRATPRELRVLERNLEESIAAEHGTGGDLAAAIADHQARVRDRKAAEAAEAADSGVDLAFLRLEAVRRAQELDLGDHAAGGELEQRADHLGHV
ncbi:MAG: hypothetical protein ACXVFL_17325 [Solirubrobacteraceae bacterium]